MRCLKHTRPQPCFILLFLPRSRDHKQRSMPAVRTTHMIVTQRKDVGPTQSVFPTIHMYVLPSVSIAVGCTTTADT